MLKEIVHTLVLVRLHTITHRRDALCVPLWKIFGSRNTFNEHKATTFEVIDVKRLREATRRLHVGGSLHSSVMAFDHSKDSRFLWIVSKDSY